MSTGVPDRLRRIRVQLMLRHPYLAGAVARLPLIAASDSEWCPTAATDGYHIVVNAGFLDTLSDDEVEFVLAHEILHCVLGHGDRRRDRDRARWNRAADYAVNQTLIEFGFSMPDGALFATRFRGQTAEAIYAALGLWRPGLPDADPLPAGPGLADGWSRVTAALSVDQVRRLVAEGGWDVQLDPADHEGSHERGATMPSELDRRRMRQGLAASLAGAMVGRSGAFAEEELVEASTARIEWEALLSRFVTGLRYSDFRTYPYNRKHVHRGLYLPSMGSPGPRHLVVAIDTSGSIDGQTAGRLLAEVDGLRSATQCRLTLLEVDDELRAVREFEAWDPALFEPESRSFTIHGRGGTVFTPAFEWIERENQTTDEIPDALIYLTDGYGIVGTIRPVIPVVWVVTHDGPSEDAFPFGSVIRMPRAHAAWA